LLLILYLASGDDATARALRTLLAAPENGEKRDWDSLSYRRDTASAGEKKI
jgi:hypothetical protein